MSIEYNKKDKLYNKPGPYERYPKYQKNGEFVKEPSLISKKIHYAVDSAGFIFSKFKRMPEWKQSITKQKFGGTENLSLNETALRIENEKSKKENVDYFRLICQILNGVAEWTDENPSGKDPNGWTRRVKYFGKLKEIFNYDVNVCHNNESVCFPNEWHNPLDKIMSCFYSYYGFVKPYYNIFGNRTPSRIHQGVDLFAEPQTPVYACVDSFVYSAKDEGTGGLTVRLLSSHDRQIKIMRARRRNYKRLFVKNQWNITKGKDKGGAPKVVGIASYYKNIDSFDELESGPEFDISKGVQFVYMHLSRADVKAGDFVVAGTKIGLSGTTGNAKNTKESMSRKRRTNRFSIIIC